MNTYDEAFDMSKGTPYSLVLTKKDIATIYFVGNRYSWSKALIDAGVTHDEPNRFTESEAWNIVDAFNEDTEGDHSFFPMLDSQSELYKKLMDFREGIV